MKGWWSGFSRVVLCVVVCLHFGCVSASNRASSSEVTGLLPYGEPRHIGLVIGPNLETSYREHISDRLRSYMGRNWRLVELKPGAIAEKLIYASARTRSGELREIIVVDLILNTSEVYNSQFMRGNKDRFRNLGPKRESIWDNFAYGLTYRGKDTLTHSMSGTLKLLSMESEKEVVNQVVNVEAGAPLGVMAFETRNGEWTESLETDVCNPRNRRYSRVKDICKELAKDRTEVERAVRNSATVQLDKILKQFATECLIAFRE